METQDTLLGLPGLHRTWQRISSGRQNRISGHDWNQEIRLFCNLGLGMEEVMNFLFGERPDFKSFEEWVIRRNPALLGGDTLEAIRRGENNPEMKIKSAPALSAADLDSWKENGYIVLPGAVSAEDCDAAAAAIWEFLGANPAEPSGWYAHHDAQRGLMYQFFNHPALHRNRLSPRIRAACAQLYASEDIYVSIDKVSFNPPETENSRFKGSGLHWDVSLVTPVPMDIQGLLYLDDVAPEQGAFQCVPGFHKKIDSWLDNLPPGTDPRMCIAEEVSPITISGKKGDFIAWHQALPHCASPNKGKAPRLVQYITWHLNDRFLASEWR